MYVRTNHILITTRRTFTTTSNLYTNQVRVRFAPSPTGKIHLGGLRTALYNYLFARQNNGAFLLRIEDTDQSRIVPDSDINIGEILNWANLKPDESPTIGGPYGPYRQSERLKIYQDHAEQLVRSNQAYRCFCSTERLELLRNHQARNREKPRYDGKCKDLNPSEVKEKLSSSNSRHVIRFSLQHGERSFEDGIFGRITNNLVQNKEGDPIILKSDLYPTYHFANVIDDHLMKISHVLRGSEWISSTIMHIQLYEAFRWSIPTFLHFPLIVMKDGLKMSKRNNNSHVETWRNDGYWPLALINFLTSMGGGLPKKKQDSMDVWPLDRLVEQFDFSQVSSHPSSVDLDRLRKFNHNHLRSSWQCDRQEILNKFKEALKSRDISTDLEDDQLKTIIGKFIEGRIDTLNDLLTTDNIYIWQRPSLTWSKKDYIDMGWDLKIILERLINICNEIDISNKESLNSELIVLAKDCSLEKAKLMQFIRKSLTNSDKGLPIYDLFSCLGKKRLLDYLNSALAYVS